MKEETINKIKIRLSSSCKKHDRWDILILEVPTGKNEEIYPFYLHIGCYLKNKTLAERKIRIRNNIDSFLMHQWNILDSEKRNHFVNILMKNGGFENDDFWLQLYKK